MVRAEDMKYKYVSLTNGVQTGSVRIENEGLMDPIPMQAHYSMYSQLAMGLEKISQYLWPYHNKLTMMS